MRKRWKVSVGVGSSVSIVTMLWVNYQQEHCAQPGSVAHSHTKSRVQHAHLLTH